MRDPSHQSSRHDVATGARTHLSERYPLLPRKGEDFRVVSAIAGMDRRVEWRDTAVQYSDFVTEKEYPPASGDDAVAALTLLTGVRFQLDGYEARLIDAARRDGKTWSQIAEVLGLCSAGAAQRRREVLAAASPLTEPGSPR